MIVSCSFLSENLKPKEIVKELENTEIDYIHVDIMDGVFVKEKTWTFSEVKNIVSVSTKKLDVHLMVKNPIKYIKDYALLNTEYITFHSEIENIDSVINLIKEYGIKVGISIKPKTKIEVLLPYLEKIDLVLVMSVEPGKSGQEFDEKVLEKIEKLKNEINKRNLKTIISVDGGIDDEKAFLLKEKGADMIVSASFIQKDIKNNIKILKNIV